MRRSTRARFLNIFFVQASESEKRSMKGVDEAELGRIREQAVGKLLACLIVRAPMRETQVADIDRQGERE